MHAENVFLWEERTRLSGHGDGLGFHRGLLRDGHGDGGVGGASGANTAGAALQQLFDVIQLSPCQVAGTQTMLDKYHMAINPCIDNLGIELAFMSCRCF